MDDRRYSGLNKVGFAASVSWMTHHQKLVDPKTQFKS
jgi:hypothetical protein